LPINIAPYLIKFTHQPQAIHCWKKITRMEELTFAKVDQLVQIHHLSITRFYLFYKETFVG